MATRAVTRAEVLSAYRYLLRSISLAFQGDTIVMTAAKKEARNRFDAGQKEVSPESPGAFAGIQEARDVGKFLRRNLVQGVKDGKEDTYSTLEN